MSKLGGFVFIIALIVVSYWCYIMLSIGAVR